MEVSWRYPQPRLGNVQRDFSQQGAALEQPEAVFADKTNPNEEAEKETEVACEFQQRTISHQVHSKTEVPFQGSYHDFLLSRVFLYKTPYVLFLHSTVQQIRRPPKCWFQMF